MECGKNCEVYSRVVGYFRPVGNWNIGKKEEFSQRVEFDNAKALSRQFESPIKEIIDEDIVKIEQNGI